jgi:hypothetical protein
MTYLYVSVTLADFLASMTYPWVRITALTGCRASMTYLRVIITGLAGVGKYDLPASECQLSWLAVG